TCSGPTRSRERRLPRGAGSRRRRRRALGGRALETHAAELRGGPAGQATRPRITGLNQPSRPRSPPNAALVLARHGARLDRCCLPCPEREASRTRGLAQLTQRQAVGLRLSDEVPMISITHVEVPAY